MFRTLEISDPALTPPGYTFATAKSAALGQRGDITIYAPPGSVAASPVVILLHGVYGSHWAWAFRGGAAPVIDALIAAGEIRPMVLAMPSDGLWGDGSGYVPHGKVDFERWIIDEVPEVVRAVIGPSDVPPALFIAGLSMGGFGALRLAGRYPERLAAVSAHSAITDLEQIDPMIAEQREGWGERDEDRSVLTALLRAPAALPPLRFDCGLDDALLPHNRKLHDALDAAKVPHVYEEFPGGHEWPYWNRHLADSLRFFERHLAMSPSAA